MPSGGLRDSEINIVLKTSAEGSAQYDALIAKLKALGVEGEITSTKTQRLTRDEGELAKAAGLTGREVDKAVVSVKNMGREAGAAADGARVAGIAWEKFSRGLGNALGNIPLLGGVLDPLVTSLGAIGHIGALGFLVLAAAAAAALIPLSSLVVVIGAIVGLLVTAIAVVAVFAAGVAGLGLAVAAALGPIGLLVAGLAALDQQQSVASQKAATNLQTATASYQSAVQALSAAQAGGPAGGGAVGATNAARIATEQLSIANQKLAAAKQAAADSPSNVTLQNAVVTATVAQQQATNSLASAQQAQSAQAQRVSDAQQKLSVAQGNLTTAQQAAAATTGRTTGAFAGLGTQLQAVGQQLTTAAQPALAAVATVIGSQVIPAVGQLGLQVVHWLNDVIGPTLKAVMPFFNDLLGLVQRAGIAYAGFVQAMLGRGPELQGVFRDLGRLGIDALKGLFDNLLRFTDWFSAQEPKLISIVRAIFGGFGEWVQAAANNIAAFVNWVIENWPTIGPAFEQVIRIVIGAFAGLWVNFQRLVLWLSQSLPSAWTHAQPVLFGLGSLIQAVGAGMNEFGKAVNAVDWAGIGKQFIAFGSGFQSGFNSTGGPQNVASLGDSFSHLGSGLAQLGSALGGVGKQGSAIGLLGQLFGVITSTSDAMIGGIADDLALLAQGIAFVVTSLQRLFDFLNAHPLDLGKAIQSVIGFNPFTGQSASGTTRGQHAEGGLIEGGTPGRDSVPALLMPGEFVMRTAAVQRIGLDALSAMNEGRATKMAAGGLVVRHMASGGSASGAGSDQFSRMAAALERLEGKMLGTTVVNANAVDYQTLAREIVKAQRFASSAGAI